MSKSDILADLLADATERAAGRRCPADEMDTVIGYAREELQAMGLSDDQIARCLLLVDKIALASLRHHE